MKGGQFARAYYDMLGQPAFRSMPGSAVKILFELWTRFNGKNNGELWLSYREAHALLQMNKEATARAFEELHRRGFIVRTSNGYFGGEGRRAPKWRLTMVANKGEVPTRDYERWQTGADLRTTIDPEVEIDARLAEARL